MSGPPTPIPLLRTLYVLNEGKSWRTKKNLFLPFIESEYIHSFDIFVYSCNFSFSVTSLSNSDYFGPMSNLGF